MKYPSICLVLLPVLLMVAGQSFATGRMTCDSGDPANWQSTDTLRSTIEADGWKIRKIKEDGGCYEVYGITPDGQSVEAYFDPLTLEKLLVARRGEILFRKPQGNSE